MKKTEPQLKNIIDFITELKSTAPIEYTEEGSEQTDACEAFLKEHGYIAFTDPANVCMICTNNQRIARTAIHMLDFIPVKVPTLEYDKHPGSSKYSTQYLKIVLKFCTVFSESVRLHTGGDYPLTAEWTFEDGTYLKYILAPRVERD